MRNVLYGALPVGLGLLVAAAAWAVLFPAVFPIGYRVAIPVGAVLFVLGMWGRRAMLMREGGAATMRYGAGALASVGIAVGILLLVNFASARYYERWDLTRTKGFSLHPVSERVLEGVSEPVEIYGFIPGHERFQRNATQRMYEVFEYEQPLLETEVVDPNARPDLVSELGVRGTNLTIVARGDRRVVFPGHEEEDLAAAILEITRTKPKVVYWLQGYDQRRLDADAGNGYNRFARDLQNDFYEVRPLTLGAGESIPDDASLLVLPDPRREIPEAVAQIVHRFLRNGGRVMVLTDVDYAQPVDAPHPAHRVLERWGLRAPRAIIFDPRARTGDRDPRVVVGDDFETDFEPVAGLAGALVVFNQARPIEFFMTTEDRQIFHRALVRVGEEMPVTPRAPYVETDLERAATSTEINEQAQASWAARPRRVAIAAYRGFEAQPGTNERGREARLVLIGDADFLTDREYDTEANAELGLNLVRWLAGEELLIRREGEERLAKEAMNLEPSQMQTLLALGLAVPIGVFLSGWIVWFFRRSK